MALQLTDENIKEIINSGKPVVGHKIQFDDSDEFAILVADRELSGAEAKMFFTEIMEYHQAINDDLSEEESNSRAVSWFVMINA